MAKSPLLAEYKKARKTNAIEGDLSVMMVEVLEELINLRDAVDLDVKTVVLNGRTALTEGGQTLVAHGIASNKIVSLDGVVRTSASAGICPVFTVSPGLEFHLSYDATNIIVSNSATNSENILDKAFRIFVTYKD